MDFGERLTMLRTAKGLTQAQAAENIGISRGAYANYEAGKRMPDERILRQIAEYYGVSGSYLRGVPEVQMDQVLMRSAIGESVKHSIDVSQATRQLAHMLIHSDENTTREHMYDTLISILARDRALMVNNIRKLILTFTPDWEALSRYAGMTLNEEVLKGTSDTWSDPMVVAKLAEYFGVEPGYLLGDESSDQHLWESYVGLHRLDQVALAHYTSSTFFGLMKSTLHELANQTGVVRATEYDVTTGTLKSGTEIITVVPNVSNYAFVYVVGSEFLGTTQEIPNIRYIVEYGNKDIYQAGGRKALVHDLKSNKTEREWLICDVHREFGQVYLHNGHELRFRAEYDIEIIGPIVKIECNVD
ncbi:helix-turn-helix transcriptional regulator [Alicyclobacillus cycloheptanicus]|uniref:Transcriptional regulator with XRE-family HTH domain n=1 Tax=Alicyclobacillus cycloheptanicus TaxID=1457 RepID=A0ABT9XK04_9BACL|nr:helix-turn-helix transcriptional regulator [Alicyclobacillus cycloheptanicus]MDQ0190649.1 transcriptional regulator with XRE-family HTH domain [Alicyclobacillus cycloheptanicus]WDM01847.1 helix-turn-helix transcriptional regulator [Alicyclobacillus cycloheptanicus]